MKGRTLEGSFSQGNLAKTCFQLSIAAHNISTVLSPLSLISLSLSLSFSFSLSAPPPPLSLSLFSALIFSLTLFYLMDVFVKGGHWSRISKFSGTVDFQSKIRTIITPQSVKIAADTLCVHLLLNFQ